MVIISCSIPCMQGRGGSYAQPPGCRPSWIQILSGCTPPQMQTPTDADPLWMQTPGHAACDACWEANPLVNRVTHKGKNITLPQTSFVGGNYHNLNTDKRKYTHHSIDPCQRCWSRVRPGNLRMSE